MDKAHPLSFPMIVHLLDVKKDPFHHCENGEELLGPEVPYLSTICAFMYLANCVVPQFVQKKKTKNKKHKGSKPVVQTND